MIVYYKLTNLLKTRNMKYIDLQRELDISPTLIAKFQKNRTITTETIDKVCSYLKVQPSEIMEWVEDETALRERELQAQIDALQKELAEIHKNKKN